MIEKLKMCCICIFYDYTCMYWNIVKRSSHWQCSPDQCKSFVPYSYDFPTFPQWACIVIQSALCTVLRKWLIRQKWFKCCSGPESWWCRRTSFAGGMWFQMRMRMRGSEGRLREWFLGSRWLSQVSPSHLTETSCPGGYCDSSRVSEILAQFPLKVQMNKTLKSAYLCSFMLCSLIPSLSTVLRVVEPGWTLVLNSNSPVGGINLWQVLKIHTADKLPGGPVHWAPGHAMPKLLLQRGAWWISLNRHRSQKASSVARKVPERYVYHCKWICNKTEDGKASFLPKLISVLKGFSY